MRYLVKRDDFIRTAKAVETKSDFMLEKANANKIFEEAGGPFTNDIGWHDSLVGRLIDHIIRKAKIAANLMRIKPLTRRLRMQFDQLAAEGTIAGMDSEGQTDAHRLIIGKIYEELINLVDNEGNVGEIKRVTKQAIESTEELIPKFDEKERTGLETAKKELDEFYKWLQQFDDNEGAEPTSDEEEEEEEEVDDTGSRIVNFGHLYNMMLIFQGIKREESAYYQNLQKQKVGQTPQPGTGVNAGTGTGQTTTTTTTATATNASRLYSYDQFMTLNEATPTGGTATGGVANTVGKAVGAVVKFFRGGKDERKPDTQTVNLFNALKPLWDLFNTDKGVLELNSELHKFLKTHQNVKSNTKDTTYNKYKGNIDKIYNTIGATGVVKEAVHDFLGKSDQIGKMISKIYSVTKTKPNGDFPEYPGVLGDRWSEFCQEIKKFNLTMKNAVPVTTEKNGFKEGDYASYKSADTGNQVTKKVVRADGNKVVFKDKKGQEFSVNIQNVTPAEAPTQESILTKLFEAEDGNEQESEGQTEPGLIETGTISERIKDFFDKRCKTVRSYVLDKAEVEKISANLDKLADSKNFVIDGFDPVIQIVRLFNRAYKIYTTETISKRSNGKVAPSVFNEYTSFGGRSGGGDLNGWSGPYRNIRLFNVWEDAVLEIMADKKYEFIFSKNTKLRLALVSNPQKPEDYEYRKEAGAKLRDFMLDILDGEELYKSGSSSDSKGSQKKFLEKYFGPVSSTDTGSTTFPEDDPGKIAAMAEKIDESARMVDFQEIRPKTPWTPNTFFALEVRFTDEDGKDKQGIRYFRMLSDKSIMFSKTFYYFDQMIKHNANEDPLDGRTFKAEKGRLRGDKLENRIKPDKGDSWQVCYAGTRNNIDVLFRAGQKLEITYVDGRDYREKKTEKFTIDKVLWLSEKTEKGDFEPFVLKIDKEKFAKIIEKINAGGRVKLAKDPTTHISQASTTSINIQS